MGQIEASAPVRTMMALELETEVAGAVEAAVDFQAEYPFLLHMRRR